MLIKAEQKYIKMSPQKLRLVVEAVKHFSPREALDHLQFLNKRAALPLAKTIKQAIANGVNNKKIKSEELKFASIEISPGPILKRSRPVSRGRSHPILKRTSHIKIILESKKQKTKSKNKIPNNFDQRKARKRGTKN